MSRKCFFEVLVVILLSFIFTGCSAEEKMEINYHRGKNSDFTLIGVKNTQQVAQITGENSINHTDKYLIYGTDLGSMFEHKGKTYMVFGDTFGARGTITSGAGGSNWRNNTMAIIEDEDPTDGLTISGMITNKQGMAKELVGSKRIDDLEKTVIPTYGFSANGNMYLYIMSVKKWAVGVGEWLCNYGGLAKSTDDGQTWEKLDNVKWPGNSNFVQVSVLEIGDYLYFWGIPQGRGGRVKLMRVKGPDVEVTTKYQYFSGMNGDNPIWSDKMEDAVTIVEGPVGELSVAFNEYLGSYIMTYLNKESGTIDIREGLTPWGPWGQPFEICSRTQYPQLYGPFMHEKYTLNNGETIFFNLSLWRPYNVFWFKTSLIKDSATQ